jgi:putative ATP-dependent endonuclease of the OLD family
LGASDEVCVKAGSLTVIVGQNDVGKSTVLKALNALLGDGSITEDHFCRFTQERVIEITGTFSPQGTSLNIDDNVTTTFEDEELVDGEGLVKLRKRWTFNGSRMSSEVFVWGSTEDDGEALVTLTQAELIKRCNSRGIQTRSASAIEYNNAEKRNKLRLSYREHSEGRRQDWVSLSLTGSGRKKTVYDGICNALPRFEYFRADSSLEETDTTIQNYLRREVTDAIEGCNLADIEAIVKQRLNGVLTSLTSKINRTVSQEERVEPHIEFDWSKLVKTTFRTHNQQFDVPLSQRGDGFRRIAMMSFFEHLAELGSDNNTARIVFGFEEPETFLHPKAQEQLFDTISALPQAGHQVVLCTHSPVLVARSPLSSLTHVFRDGMALRVQQSDISYRQIADDLGVSIHNQFVGLFERAKALVLVEGADDVRAMQHCSSTYKKAGLIPETLESLGVVLMPVGGCSSLQHWVSLDILTALGKPFFIILDSDRLSDGGFSKNRDGLINLRVSSGFALEEKKHFVVTRKRELENYIPARFLNDIEPSAQLSYTDFCDVKMMCKKLQPSNVQSAIGGKHVARMHFHKMKVEDLREGFAGPDGQDEFLMWYDCVKRLLPQGNV